MKFEYFRLVLVENEQPSLFAPPKQTREDWLRRVFSERIAFEHRKAIFEFVPTDPIDRNFIAGKVGRERLVKENAPPDEGLADVHRAAWKAIDLIIDPRHHQDGQKVAAEDNVNVGKGLSVLRSLLAAIALKSEESPFFVEINPIADPETFWNFVRENKGEITSVTFELIAPNMFGQRNQLDKEMKELKENEKVRSAKITLKNDAGLDLETERVRETASYAAEGGGNISARTKRKRTYNSKGKAKRTAVVPRQPSEEDAAFLRRIVAILFPS